MSEPASYELAQWLLTHPWAQQLGADLNECDDFAQAILHHLSAIGYGVAAADLPVPALPEETPQ